MNIQKHSTFISAKQLAYRPSTPLAKLMVLSFMLCSLKASAQATYTLSIPDTTLWTDTHIVVGAGSLLNISASGIVRYGNDFVSTTGPGGTNSDGTVFFPNMPLPNTVVVSLIGKIGGTTAANTGTLLPQGQPGTGPGYVGSQYNLVVPTGGELFLGFNDNYFLDNSGSFDVTVTVSAVPEPSSVTLAVLGGLALVTMGRMALVYKRSA